ncbi:MAG TPA: hypothetical protein VFM46_10720, partial [Pseudomonadales bacterium]|nr:hypothetical protein [Pseudomonadales bacterium]
MSSCLGLPWWFSFKGILFLPLGGGVTAQGPRADSSCFFRYSSFTWHLGQYLTVFLMRFIVIFGAYCVLLLFETLVLFLVAAELSFCRGVIVIFSAQRFPGGSACGEVLNCDFIILIFIEAYLSLL